ncbi:DUF1573 domain-containing protein [Rubripirellula reticaptiva]|uniref:DUF1573 domain-containing protein n=1 Tax=Rubripirellula reticaptiva TaxID=2528013 RepID=A0A5C6EPU0_9BACT|nr:DUF1573 domain-containing protein [Rubripirellula reticaptiva]TWU49606.1 hypothetical protein Poly59_42230 [Rubripirellula reticaptiva]
MKNFWIFVLLSAVAGATAAWAINHKRYGYRDSAFGPFVVNGQVTTENVERFISLNEVTTGEKVGRVEIDGDLEYDFGVMSPGDEGSKVFKIRNTGGGPLKLRVGASTCKCTIGELNKEALDPGEETEIKLSWKVKSGESEFGQSAQLLTNDPRMVAITLKITGKVIEEFLLVPDAWSAGEVATGDPIEFEGSFYNYTDTKIKTKDVRFSSETMNELAEFDVQPLEPSEYAAGNGNAIQGFRVVVKLKPGMKQGNFSQNLMVGFVDDDESADVTDAESDTDANDAAEDGPKSDGLVDGQRYLTIPVSGRVVGTLRMLESSKLTLEGGEYVYNFGRIGPDDDLTARAFVVLKGKERDNTTLTIGETKPDGVVKAKLGEAKGRGSMVLYPLEIELVAGDKLISRLGKDRSDYGSIWIESDNPKVSRMRVVLKFAIEGR